MGSTPLIFRLASSVISPAVTDVFNRSLSKCSLPIDLKYSKSGNLSKLDNYGPICLAAILAKIAKIVKKSLVQLSGHKDIRTPVRHGFIPGRPRITNLLVMRREWLPAVNRRKSVDTVYIDLAKRSIR